MSTTKLKFGNRWYEQATAEPIAYPLLVDRTIKIINAPLFLCTKFDAYKQRGKEDKKDLEDIIVVVDGRRELLDNLQTSSDEIKTYVADSTQRLLDDNLASRLNWFLPTDAAGVAREKLVRDRLMTMTQLIRP